MNMKIMTFSSALLLLSVTIVKAAELNCAKDPTGTMGQTLSNSKAREKCGEMGYTRRAEYYSEPFRENEKICGDGTILHCPLDLSYISCIPKLPLKVLYGDGTVSHYLLQDKVAIGIVFDEKNNLAVAIYKDYISDYAGSIAKWSTSETQAWTTLCGSDEFLTCRTSGKENTQYLLSKGADLYPAAKFANEYEPEGCTKEFCRQGKWWLPSAKEAYMIQSYDMYLPLVGPILSRNGYKGGYGSINFMGWTSNEVNDKEAFYAMEYGYLDYKKTSEQRVYPIVKY